MKEEKEGGFSILDANLNVLEEKILNGDLKGAREFFEKNKQSILDRDQEETKKNEEKINKIAKEFLKGGEIDIAKELFFLTKDTIGLEKCGDKWRAKFEDSLARAHLHNPPDKNLMERAEKLREKAAKCYLLIVKVKKEKE